MKNKFLVAMIATVALSATSCIEKMDIGANADETSVAVRITTQQATSNYSYKLQNYLTTESFIVRDAVFL